MCMWQIISTKSQLLRTEALGTEGRILVRESGTEPLLRVMVEASTQELCEAYVTKVISTMKNVQ